MGTIPLLETVEPTLVPERVRVHRNLNQRGPNGEVVWSVVDPLTGRVCAHTYQIALSEVRMKVQPGGRARVLAEKQKNVHAFIEGRPVTFTSPCARLLTYDPYRSGYFFDVATGLPLWDAELVTFDLTGAAAFEKTGW